MIVDPHGDMARKLMLLIPKERWDEVIYIGLSSIYRFGRTVRINPLEIKTEDERSIVPLEVVNMIRNSFDFWGTD